jgi:hypothetical protein
MSEVTEILNDRLSRLKQKKAYLTTVNPSSLDAIIKEYEDALKVVK